MRELIQCRVVKKATASIGSGSTCKRKSKGCMTVSDAKIWLQEMNVDIHSGMPYVGDDVKITDSGSEWPLLWQVR
ncbi:hypothetical protein FKV75_06285 [Weissella paramesenteroides]|uniref:hypothetical protein n=1 Tax=Weissella paramesenteroides TaxID=1249 RepID=UPI0012398957|nr:hypothetical protein [Weissella paramesenteroides]KAA8440500.1 hypothetical protein FKV81_05275 [Weissella paramesenteroides]KAA8442410.1 hypothetical protein FKV75_06285 [Weissella paramesenteroides]KAA8443804.1 hypothetical protein FKV77_03575 [Weissella paramesenteroides]KAA8450030.1 hypothetical protein FKV74_03915 [Weissella paramesenteroides]